MTDRLFIGGLIHEKLGNDDGKRKGKKMNEFNFRLVNKSCATCKARFPNQASNHILVSCPRDENMTDDFVSYEIEDYEQFENFEDVFEEMTFKEANNEKDS